MSYVRDNGLARARRRRERRALAILVLCALLVVGALVFATTFMSRSGKDAACPNGTASVPADPRTTFTLNVYNAGGQKGAAGSAADALRSHGFSVGVVGNDPYRKKVTGAGEVRFGAGGAAKAKQYVASLVPGTRMIEDGRDGSSVDVVVGPSFPSIAPGAASEATPTGPVCK